MLSIAPPPITTLVLSARLAIQWPSLIRTLNGLEKDGLVQRIVNPNDKRSRYIEITPAGTAVVQQAQPMLAKIRAAVFRDMTTDEMQHATRVLEMIASGVSRAQEAAPDDP